ncbi:hypothetical protein ACEPAI_10045 [Sanghuangporus weigelae]
MNPSNRINRFARQPPTSSASPYNDENNNSHHNSYQSDAQAQLPFPRSQPVPIPHSTRELDDFDSLTDNEQTRDNVEERSPTPISRHNSSEGFFGISPWDSFEGRHSLVQPPGATSQIPFRYTPPQTERTIPHSWYRVRCPYCSHRMWAHEDRYHRCEREHNSRDINARTVGAQAMHDMPVLNTSSGVHLQLQEHGMAPRDRNSQARPAQPTPAYAAYNGLAGISSSTQLHPSNIPIVHDQGAGVQRRRRCSIIQLGSTASRPPSDRPWYNRPP